MIEIAFGRGIQLAGPLALHQDLEKQREEIEIFLGGRERKRIDFEILRFQAHANIGAAEQLRQAFKTSAQVENEGVRCVLLETGDQEIEQKRLPRAGSPEDHGVRDIAVMEIQKIRRVVIGLKDRQILRAQVPVADFARIERKQKREVRVVGVRQIQIA